MQDKNEELDLEGINLNELDLDNIDLETADLNLEFTDAELLDLDDIDLDSLDLDGSSNPDVSEWDVFKYAFSKEGSATRDLGDFLESHIPLGRIDITFGDDGFYVSPTETYGEQWIEASPQQRREMIINKRSQELLEEFGSEVANVVESGEGGTLGALAAGVADPINLFPFGRGVASAVKGGAAVGAVTSGAEDLSKTGTVDPVGVFVDSAIGAVTAGTLQKTGEVVKKGMDKRAVRKAQEVIDKAETPDAYKALKDKGYTDEDIVKVYSKSTSIGQPLKSGRKNTASHEVEVEQIVTRHAHSQRDNMLDKALGKMSTRLENIDPEIARRMRRFELDTRKSYTQYMDEASSYIKAYRASPDDVKKAVDWRLANGKYDEAIEVAGRETSLGKAIPSIQKFFTDRSKELRAVGKGVEEDPNYFARYIKDYNKMYDELYSRLGSKTTGAINKKIQEYADKKNINFADVPQQTKERIANTVVRAYDPIVGQGVPSNLKARKILNLDEDTYANHYASSDEAILKYISGVSHDIHASVLFGKNGFEGSLDQSVGALALGKNLSSDKQADLTSIVSARFGGGRTSSNKFIQDVRNIDYMATLGNPYSTITQLSDLGISAWRNGFSNTIKAFFGAVGNKSKLKLIDVGMDDRIIQEFSEDPRKTAQALDWVFRKTGFKAFDRIGKETLFNSHITKYQGLAKTKKGQDAIRAKWGAYYGDDTDKLIRDLSEGKVTPLTKEHAFTELSNVQPVTMIEMPEAYANNPDLRILYALKSFTLNMWDIYRKEVYREFQSGNKLRATRNLFTLSLALGASNLGTQKLKDMLMGKDIKPENVPEDFMWAFLGVLGAGKYQATQISRQGLGETLYDLGQPPLKVVEVGNSLIDLATETPKSEDPLKEKRKVVENIPVVGKPVAFWFMGGAEAANKREQ